MKTDRELLELAARAAGYEWDHWYEESQLAIVGGRVWNPLTDDGDALRLAVKLRFGLKDFSPTDDEEIVPAPGFVEIWREADDDPIWTEYYEPGADRHAATRRAIVRAAAVIGESMGGADGSANNETD